MQRRGTITRFDTDRGFGFLRCPQSPADVFFHVKDFDQRAGPPTPGQAVDFEEIHVGGKGPRAMAVRPAGMAERGRSAGRPARAPVAPRAQAPVGRSSPAPGLSASLPLFLLALLAELSLLGWCITQHRLPFIVLVCGLVLNAATFWLYWHDKHSAQQQAWRVRESSLHLLALAGGWPAAWWAQQLLRHKSRKQEFRLTYTATVLAHLGALAAFTAWTALR